MIGYKKVAIFKGLRNLEAVATLDIPDDSKKCNPKASNKWRCSKAKVIKIELLDETETANSAWSCICTMQGIRGVNYVVGKIVRPLNGYDDDNTIECSRGIHFFLSKQEAIDYYKGFIV